MVGWHVPYVRELLGRRFLARLAFISDYYAYKGDMAFYYKWYVQLADFVYSLGPLEPSNLAFLNTGCMGIHTYSMFICFLYVYM